MLGIKEHKKSNAVGDPDSDSDDDDDDDSETEEWQDLDDFMAANNKIITHQTIKCKCKSNSFPK